MEEPDQRALPAVILHTFFFLLLPVKFSQEQPGNSLSSKVIDWFIFCIAEHIKGSVIRQATGTELPLE